MFLPIHRNHYFVMYTTTNPDENLTVTQNYGYKRVETAALEKHWDESFD